MKRINNTQGSREAEHLTLQAYVKNPQDSPRKSDWNPELAPAKARPHEVLHTLRAADEQSLQISTDKDSSPLGDSLQSQLAQLQVKETSPGRLLADHKSS